MEKEQLYMYILLQAKIIVSVKKEKPVEKSGGGLFEEDDEDELFNETKDKPKKEEPPAKKVKTLMPVSVFFSRGHHSLTLSMLYMYC